MKKLTTFLLSLCGLCGNANSQAPEIDSLLEFTRGFKVGFDYTIDKLAKNNQIAEPINVQRVKYKSTEPFTVDDSGKWFMRFSLDIISYKDSSEAKRALEGLRVKSEDVASLSKCQEYIVQKEAEVYWISAPCHFWDISM